MRIRILTIIGPMVPLLSGLHSPLARADEKPPEQSPPSSPLEATNQEMMLTFQISAKGSGLPVSKAEVRWNDTVVYSDARGSVRLTLKAPFTGSVTISRKGFETIKLGLDEIPKAGVYEVRLYPSTPDDDVIIVTGKRKSSISYKSVSIEEASKVAPGGDPAQIVKLLPGVQSTSGGGRGGGGRGGGGGNQVVVQGSGPYDTRYFIDDLEVPFIFHSFGDLSVIPGDMLRSVEFESAGFGAEHGDATGGIITLRTKEDIPERAKTNFVLNIPFYSGILYTTPLSESSALTVGVRRSYIDFFLQKFLDARANKSGDKSSNITLAPYFSDAEVQYLTKNDDGHTKLTLVTAYDGIKAVVPGGFSPGASGQSDINFLTRFADIGVERQQRLSKEWKYVTTPQIYYYRSTFTINEIDVDNTTLKVRAPTHFTRRLDKDESLYLGLDPEHTSAKTSAYAPRLNFDDPTFDIEDAPLVKTTDEESFLNVAGWAAVDQKFGPVTVTPGVRVTQNGQIKKVVADPRLRTRYAVSEEVSIKAAVGQYSDSPQPGEASPERGNPDLNFIRAYHYVLGLETKWGELWNTDLSVYYKTGKSLVESDTSQNYANRGSMRSQGFEALIRRNLTGRLFGWLSYTYSKTEERDSGDKPWRTAAYDQTHIATLVGNYKLTGTWDLGGRYNHHTGSTYDTIEDSVYNANLDKYQARPKESDINNGRTPPINSVTVYASHDFLYDTWKLVLRFGLEQYWYKPQVDSVSYNYNYTKTQNVNSLTAIPFLELKGEL